MKSGVELSGTGWIREQTEKILATGTTESVNVNGHQVILLTVRGVKSRKLYKVPLMRVEHDGLYAIVASGGGAPKNPGWYCSVKAEPHVELQDGIAIGRYRAREVTGQERAIWWRRALAAYPHYASCQAKTARQFPVLVLEAVTD
jgi:deazaflavin-dependent oxidoreductase (nitroreductase family)